MRDNRGRFASTGATARGGRLKTAAGNKRKTVTARMAPAKAAGTVAKPKGLKARVSMPPKSYKRGRSVALGYKPKTDGTRASSQVGTRAKLSEFQRAKAQTAKQRFGVRSTAQRARMRAGTYDQTKQGSGRATFRSRPEARKAYLKRVAATKGTASKSLNRGRYADEGVKTGTKGSARFRSTSVAQGNLLSSKADNVKSRKVRSFSGRSALGAAIKREGKKGPKQAEAIKTATPQRAKGSKTRLARTPGTVAKPKGTKKINTYEVKINSKRGGGVPRIIKSQSKGSARVEALRLRYGASMVNQIGKAKIKVKQIKESDVASTRKLDAMFRRLKTS